MLSGAVAQLLCGRMADRFSESQLYFTLFLITVPLVALASQLTEIPLVLIMMIVVLFEHRSTTCGKYFACPLYSQVTGSGLFFGMKFLLGFGFTSLRNLFVRMDF